MYILKVLCAGLVSLLALIALPSQAWAQATRTWVSGVGDDANPCSRTAPCKTFAGAITKTAAGGEINCLDPGGFGAVTITKAMTISCLHTEGGALAGGNGITVNAGPGDSVFIRGLDIFGVNPPTHGVRFVAGGALHIDQSVIRRFNAANSWGVAIAARGNSKVYISDTIIADNGNGSTNSGGGIGVETVESGSVTVFVMDSIISNNAGTGIAALGQADVHVTSTRIVGNETGLAGQGGKITTYGDNMVRGNRNNGTFSGGAAKD
jgi:hypothetical protein